MGSVPNTKLQLSNYVNIHNAYAHNYNFSTVLF